MSVINFEQHQCKKISSYLDSYVNNELLVETNHEVLKHLESCKECAQTLEDRARVKDHLQRAVRRDLAPAALRERIERDIRKRDIRKRDIRKSALAAWSFNRGARLALAAAALVAVIIGSWAAVHSLGSRKSGGLEATLDERAQVLKIGLDDHINCAILHGQANRRFTPEQMAEKLGADWIGLARVVKEKAPASYEMVVAHKCHVGAREFVHMILKNQQNVLSLIITKKNSEAFGQNTAEAVMEAAGSPLYEARIQDYEAAGFETRDFLGFVVSNLGKDDNLQIASTLTHVVRDFLSKMEA